MEERFKPNSFWRPFFDTMPDNLEEYGPFLSDSEMEYLEGSTFFKFKLEVAKYIESEYEEIVHLLPEFGHSFSMQDYAFARMLLVSRAFGGVIDG
jgi:histone-lysine N-methyltransferase SETD3